MCFIRRCDPRRTAASPWPLKLSSICLHFLSRQFRCWPQPYAKDHVMVNINNIRVTNMYISMLLTYSYCLGAHRRQWMPFRPPFLTACERLRTENTSSSRINLCKQFFYCFLLNQAKPFLPNPFQRSCPRPIGCIQIYHAVGGANDTTMVMMFV